MLPLEFILTDAHFAIGMLAALACFATFWLYFDAWTGDREWKEFLKWLGYVVLALGLMLTATEVEPAFLGQTGFGELGWLGLVLRGVGYAVLAVGLVLDPLQPVPQHPPEESIVPTTGEPLVPEKKHWWQRRKKPKMQPQPPQPAPAPVPATVSAPVSPEPPQQPSQFSAGYVVTFGSFRLVIPVLSATVWFLYWRRANKGLERHLKPVMWAFAWFTAFELVDLSALARGTDDPRLYGIVAPFGPLWIGEHILLAVAAVLLGGWVWQYLTKRLQTQLFIVLTTACLVIFLVTTVSFTFLLMARVQDQAFGSLNTTAKVLNTAIAGQQAQTTAAAQVVAGSSAVAEAVAARDHVKLAALESTFLSSQHQSSLLITSDTAQVLLRADDPARWGDSVSSDSLVVRALVGKTSHGLSAEAGALTPRLVMRSSAPIRNAAGLIVGTATVGFTVDSAFVDGLKQSTGLSASIYSGSVRVATTLVAADGRSRLVGVKESNGAITDSVLTHGKTWSGLISSGGQSYLAVYAALKDADNAPVGMLFIGEPQVLLLQAAGRSIELTFLIAVGLLILSIVPIHLISKSLASQLH